MATETVWVTTDPVSEQQQKSQDHLIFKHLSKAKKKYLDIYISYLKMLQNGHRKASETIHCAHVCVLYIDVYVGVTVRQFTVHMCALYIDVYVSVTVAISMC